MNAMAEQIRTSLQTLQQCAIPAIAQRATGLMNTLNQATSGMSAVDKSLANVSSIRQYLEGDRTAIEARLPRGELSASTNAVLTEVRKSVQEVERILAERENKMSSLSSLANDVSKVRDELIRQGASADERSIFAHGFAPIAEKLREMQLDAEVQEGYMDRLQNVMESFTTARANDPVITQRQQIFEEISKAMESYKEAQRYVQEGMTFYNKLKDLTEGTEKEARQLQSQCPPTAPAPAPAAPTAAPSQLPGASVYGYQPPAQPQYQYQHPTQYQPPYQPPAQYQSPYQPPAQYQPPYQPPMQYQYQPQHGYAPQYQYQPQHPAMTQQFPAGGKSCKNCGVQNIATAAFCAACGRSL